MGSKTFWDYTKAWLRVIGDTVFAIGLFAFVWFVFSLNRKQGALDSELESN